MISLTLLFGTYYIQAGKVIDGFVDAGIYGEVINCAFPNTVTLDGKLDELAWQYAPWHIIGGKDATVAADSDKDASVKFATCADDKYIYIAAEITDDKVRSNENTGCEVWKDDSIEIYIDGENDKAGTYDSNDAQITIGADVIGVEPEVDVLADLLGGCVGINQGPTTETIATGEETDEGWNVEIAIPLENDGWKVKPQDGLIIGFNVQYNDDDDGGDRDHKLIWCVREVEQGEGSWDNPSLFAELQFVESTLAVRPSNSVVISWGAIKSKM
jgi:hypothetical protein